MHWIAIDFTELDLMVINSTQIALDCIALDCIGNENKKLKVHPAPGDLSLHQPWLSSSCSLPSQSRWQLWHSLCRRWQIGGGWWHFWRWGMTWRLDALAWPITPASSASSWTRYAQDLSYRPHLSFTHDIDHVNKSVYNYALRDQCPGSTKSAIYYGGIVLREDISLIIIFFDAFP